MIAQQLNNSKHRRQIVKVKTVWVAVVNGERCYKWACSEDEMKRLCRIEYLAKFGKCKITDVRRV